MSTHKSKLFKQVFEKNANEVFYEDDLPSNIPAQVMTQETFVPLMGEMWAKAKARYKKRYRQKAFKFVEWVQENKYTRNLHNSELFWYKESDLPNAEFKTTEELFEIWKKEN